MKQYLDLLREVYHSPNHKPDRTETGVRSIFGRQLRFCMADGFPLLTTKRVRVRSVIHELLWFLQGEQNTQYLTDNKVGIWDAWSSDGEVGPMYGHQWRHWGSGPSSAGLGDAGLGHDQIQYVIRTLKNNPHSRRIIISSWNVDELPDESKTPQENVSDGRMALAPCHVMMQFYAEELTTIERARMGPSGSGCKYKLSLQVYQRSADVFLGLPFNIASYSLLLHMVAQVVGMHPHDLVYSLGDVHLYNNHLKQARTQSERPVRKLPTLSMNKEVSDINNFQFEDFSFDGYDPADAIVAPISI